MQVKSLLAAVLRDERGATAVEYGLIAALVVLAIVSAVQGVANESTEMWEFVEQKVSVDEV